jgi:hypothetical protein
MNDRKKILLLGNGINRAFSANPVSWQDLLEKITKNKEVGDFLNANNSTGKIPFPLEVILRTDDDVSFAMKKVKSDLYGSIDSDEQKALLRKILSMGFESILTTNYSYELEMASLKDGSKLTDYALKKMQSTANQEKRAEAKYLLHTYNAVEYGNVKNKIWHIHGEARKPDSMVIGHYYYGNLLFKYKEFLTKRGNQYKQYQKNEIKLKDNSWIDDFILNDVYIIGLGMDFSEMDLWWLINRKKREKAEHGKVVYYELKKDKDYIKYKLLEVYDVEVRHLERAYESDSDYIPFYRDVLTDIEED